MDFLLRKISFAVFALVFAYLPMACSTGTRWGAGVPPQPDGRWVADMESMLREPAIRAELDRGDDAARKQFLDYLRGVRLDIRGSRLRGGSARKPGKWVPFTTVNFGRDSMTIRYRLKKNFSPANVRLNFPKPDRMRFKELKNDQSPPLFFKRAH